jgi:hypothetical protein
VDFATLAGVGVAPFLGATVFESAGLSVLWLGAVLMLASFGALVSEEGAGGLVTVTSRAALELSSRAEGAGPDIGGRDWRCDRGGQWRAHRIRPAPEFHQQRIARHAPSTGALWRSSLLLQWRATQVQHLNARIAVRTSPCWVMSFCARSTTRAVEHGNEIRTAGADNDYWASTFGCMPRYFSSNQLVRGR